jgi:type I site-specific restriction endonuclease
MSCRLEKAKTECHGLGLFVRSLLGLDREAAKQALATFLSGKTLNSNQIEFIDLIVNHLTEHRHNRILNLTAVPRVKGRRRHPN